MTRKPDSRIIKHNSTIKHAFYKLATEYSFETITITKIVKQAQLSRNTFYCRFKNLNELINTYQHDLLVEMNNQIVYKYHELVNEGDAALFNMLNYIDAHQQEFQMMLKNDVHQNFKSKFSDSIKLLLMLQTPLNDMVIKLKYEYLCEMYVAIIIKWILTGCIDFVESMHRFINHLHQPIANSNYSINNTID